MIPGEIVFGDGDIEINPGAARLEMAQEVRRDSTCLAKCRVTLACLDLGGRPARMPPGLRAALQRL